MTLTEALRILALTHTRDEPDGFSVQHSVVPGVIPCSPADYEKAWGVVRAEAGMTEARQSVLGFRVGQRVSHDTLGEGVVTHVVLSSDTNNWRARGVHVNYDAGPREVYDDDWFRNASARLRHI